MIVGISIIGEIIYQLQQINADEIHNTIKLINDLCNNGYSVSAYKYEHYSSRSLNVSSIAYKEYKDCNPNIQFTDYDGCDSIHYTKINDACDFNFYLPITTACCNNEVIFINIKIGSVERLI